MRYNESFIFRRLYRWLIPALILTGIWFPPDIRGVEHPAGANQSPVSLVDCVGRTVVLPEKIERIACLYAFTGHVVTMLGRGADIVAVSYGLKRDSLLLRICPSIADAWVPKAQGAINIEELLKARADILFLPGDVAANQAEMAKLDRFRIAYLVIDYHSIKSQQDAIALIGAALSARERAAAFNRYYRDCINRVSRVTAAIPAAQRPRLYHAVNEPLRTTIDRGIAIDWLSVAGCRNVALSRQRQLLEGKNYISLEQILIWNPDVILANEPKAKDLIIKDAKWSALKAVKSRRVYGMPIGISRWGHPGSLETPLAILWTAKTLYPDRFHLMDMAVETKDFYQTFFNYTLSDQLVSQIISGKLRRKPKKKASLGG